MDPQKLLFTLFPYKQTHTDAVQTIVFQTLSKHWLQTCLPAPPLAYSRKELSKQINFDNKKNSINPYIAKCKFLAVPEMLAYRLLSL